VKGREVEEEPEERRKKLIKRSLIALVTIAVLGAGGYYLFKSRKEAATDAKMDDAVAELGKETKDARFEAIIRRASGEYKSRASNSEKETKDALLDLQKARNTAKSIKGDADKNIILAEVAVTFTELMGTTEQVDKGARMKKDSLLSEFRQTLQSITDPDATAEAIRGITRKVAADGHPTMAEEFTHQLAKPDELVGQIGLELLRLNREAYKQQAEELLKKVSTNEAPSIQALRQVLNKPFTPKKGEVAPTTAAVAQAESAALTGDFERVMRVGGKPEEKAKALAAAANVAIDTNPAKAAEMLKAAAELLKGEAKGLVSPIIVARVCKQLTYLDHADLADSLAGAQPDESSKGWARLGVLRGRLLLSKDKKADDAWLATIGDPAKVAAAAKAHEEIARHNAANGQDYQATVKSWPSGSVRPFGTAGLILGKQDRK